MLFLSMDFYIGRDSLGVEPDPAAVRALSLPIFLVDKRKMRQGRGHPKKGCQREWSRETRLTFVMSESLVAGGPLKTCGEDCKRGLCGHG